MQSEMAAPEPRPAAVPVVRIQPRRGWARLGLGELWRHRELLWFFTTRNIRARYRQMALGPLWILIQPLVSMVIFTLIFGKLAKLPSEGVPYPIFTYTALLPWRFFSTAAQASVGSLVGQMNVISKVYFPRIVVPVSAVFTGIVDLAISFVILAGMMLAYGFGFSWRMLALPLFVLVAAAALGVGLWSAALAVRFRDLRYVVQYGIQVWMYATPVAYSARLIPEKWQALYRLNPLYWVIEGFRWALLGPGEAPTAAALPPLVFVIVLLVTGMAVFRRSERTVVDLL